MRFALLALAALFAPHAARAAEPRAYPAEITIGGPNRTQQLVVVEEVNGRAVRDLTSTAKFASGAESVAKVDAAGLVTALKSGEAKITITIGAKALAVPVKVDAGGDWSFRNHVIPTLTRAGCNMGACHGALAGKGGMKLSLRGYDPESDWHVLTRQALGRRVDGTKPDASLLLTKATRAMPHGGGERFDDASPHYTVLLDWIKTGASGPKDADAELVKIEAFPPAILTSPATKNALRVIVRATYSNGTVEDVTKLARFGSSEENVAKVSEDGTVTPAGYGEAAVTVGFGTKVAALTVTAPFPNAVPADAFAKSPRHNYIDEHTLNKLALLRLIPSEQCSDSEFVRRAYLDTCGILPQADEVTKFVADSDPKKRAKLIDTLLEHPAFVDYWALKWSDLLLVSSRKLPQPAMWAFYRKVRQGVADNQPWDRFARDVLTANGSTLTNGGGNFFVIHKDTAELAESTALAFLGTSIGCAKCHNHPLEKWTQDQYWAFANLFARVGLKNGDRAGEVLVQSKPDGDALHPRTGKPVPPAPLDGKPLAADSTADRRGYFADWLTAPDNPLFARATANRVWRAYMGRGLVEAEDDLRDTNPASNRELLDALAADFVKNKFDVKHLMRTILNSAAYQRSSKPNASNAADDRFGSRYLLRRLPGEVILDAYSDITGVPTPFDKLNSAAGDSTSPTTSFPRGTRAVQVPDSLVTSRFLDAFGRPERVQTCACERTADASVAQALHLNNGQTLNDKLRDKNSVVSKWLEEKLTDAQIVDRVFLSALSRKPTADEAKKFLAILSDAAKDGPAARREALEDFVWAVLTGREFLFNR
jgi:Protein of unknown function (DUF1553)/Protein of unknown function (DUF1549)/Bacterial Ig-like domain (group 2)